VENADAFAACGEKYGVTVREAEIIRLLLEGKGNKDITEALFISDHTVKNHIHNIYRKLGIKNRLQLVQCYRAALGETGRPPAGAAAEGGPARNAGAGLARARRFALPAVALLVTLSAAAVVWGPWARKPKAAVAPPSPALAILDFENLSDDPDLEKWVIGLPLLLTTDLLQSKSLRTLSDDAIFSALQKHNLADRARYSREELRRLARELKADYLLTGSLMKAGGAIVVTAFLQDARSGAPLHTEKIESPDEQGLMRGVDELARRIKSRLDLKAAAGVEDIDLDVEVLTTSYALAFKYYSEAMRYHHTGDYEQSLLMLRKAVELDPEFAMAYRLMSVDARNLGNYTQEADFMRTAFDLSGRLPENSRERHLIRGDYYALSESTFRLAVEAFQSVLRGNPEDLIANNNLGMLYYDLEDYEAAMRHASVPIRRNTDNPFPYHTKAAALKALGRNPEAVRLLESYHEVHPANRLIFWTLLDVLIDTHDFVAALNALERAETVFPDPSWSEKKGTVLFHTQGADAAREEFRRLFLLEDAAWHLRGYERLGSVAFAGGRFREAAEEFLRGVELAQTTSQHDWEAMLRRLRGRALLEAGDPPAALEESRLALEAGRAAGGGYKLSAAFLLRAEVHVESGDTGAAAALAGQSRALADTAGTPRSQRAHDFFSGYLELVSGRPAEALALIGKAVSRIKRRDGADYVAVPYRYYLARARERSGDEAGAADALQKMIEAPGDRLIFDGYFAKALFGLARLEDRLGRSGPAREHYQAFLAQWRNADPERPEIAEARARLEALPAPGGPAR
jgi:tetratricopeptide (TPR) repeat protein/DNA-binding CsgD family transcriptional regulator